ncbi:hypothetical protein [Corallococcus macrosporus]|uniref:Uncharacterized protein n=1 Tax=Corallococcus macrosporus DSM 14697 TaxID=1189310 RepID=A0A250K3I4_9BACT|nr:hypothetical protein [Corallococcus macrosporus]ATB50297.1 hypothetical protein MYMAC_005952 [Corallococcus macrosporus DSM 14697]
MKRASIVVSAVMMSVGFASTALATPIYVNGYICEATYTKQPNVLFGQGYVVVQVNAGANCTGSSLGKYYYLGSGASSAGHQYSEAERLSLFERATRAATQGTSVELRVEGTAGVGIIDTAYRGD